MKQAKVRRDSRAHRILISLLEGPKAHKDLAVSIGLSEKTFDYDIEVLRKLNKKGLRKAPPRRNIRIYPEMGRLLSYMSRRTLGDPESRDFLERYKPNITYNGGEWSITRYGRKALEFLEESDLN